MAIDVKICLVAAFSLFLVVNHDLIIYIDFTHIAASIRANDDVTS